MIQWSFIALSIIIAFFALPKYRIISAVVVAEFLLCKAIYLYAFVELRQEIKWLIYLLYAAMQSPIVYALYKLKAPEHLTTIISIAALYNLALAYVVYIYPSNQEFIHIYYNKAPVMFTIMSLELLFIGWLCVGDNRRINRVGAFVRNCWNNCLYIGRDRGGVA